MKHQPPESAASGDASYGEGSFKKQKTTVLAEAFKINRSVTALDLACNNIGDEVAKALAGALKTNRSVTALDLRWSKIGAEGAKALAGALKTNRSVTALNLEHNNIGDEGAKQLRSVIACINKQRQKEREQLQSAIALILLDHGSQESASPFHKLPLEMIHLIIRLLLPFMSIKPLALRL